MKDCNNCEHIRMEYSSKSHTPYGYCKELKLILLTTRKDCSIFKKKENK